MRECALYKGTVVSSGSSTSGSSKGVAKIIDSEEDFSKIQDGDILVTYRSSPAWIIPLMRAGGLVCEIGGVVSHIAILCRELGVPCISGIPGIFTSIKEGNILFIDCKNGEVHEYVL